MAEQTSLPGGEKLLNAKTLLEKAGIEEKMKVADLGCGRRGHFVLQAAKLVGRKGIVCAVDVVKDVLENVKSAAKLYGIENIKTIWADVEVYKSTKIPDNAIDIAMLNNILFQTNKEKQMFEEVYRILKKGGKLLVVDWKKAKAPFGPPVENRVDPKTVKQYGKEVGLKLKQEFDAGPYHYALIFTKS
ncbi:class I SAM-dependent methyltransferase [Patescibacteria group bacterium AH-259-L05]|nr:class I SAM-dependent methyltransferase [Patescibacteria group bacterium AH-259-L05]